MNTWGSTLGPQFQREQHSSFTAKVTVFSDVFCLVMDLIINPLSPKSRSKTNFSFQFTASYVWYSMENLAGDLLFGLKFVKLSILPTLFIHFV